MTDPNVVNRGQRLAKILGIIAGLLAWTAALIRYLKSGEVELGLIAAGLFIMAISFAAKPGAPKQG